MAVLGLPRAVPTLFTFRFPEEQLLREYVQRFQDPSSKATDWWILFEPLGTTYEPAADHWVETAAGRY